MSWPKPATQPALAGEGGEGGTADYLASGAASDPTAVVSAGLHSAPGGAVHNGAGLAPAGHPAAAVIFHSYMAVKAAIPHHGPQSGVYVAHQTQVTQIEGGLRVVPQLGGDSAHDASHVGISFHSA